MNAVMSPTLTIDGFEAGDIDADRFDHEAHVYVAWLYVRRYPLPIAISKFDTALRHLVAKLGANGKYHATLTWFFLLLIGERVRDEESWIEFRQRNPDLFDSKTLLARYYSKEYLFSDAARQRFLLPDRLAA